MKGVRAILFNQAERTDRTKIENIRREFPDLNLFFGSLEQNVLIERKMP